MIELQKDLDLTNYTLILPSVAVGNLGQLSVDVLIAALNLRRAGRIFNTSFIPLVGSDPYDETSEDICTALDLYVSVEKKLVALQIRSPLVQKPMEFFHEILNFVTDHKIAKVIILTSSFGYDRHDEQIRTQPFRYLASEKVIVECDKQFQDLSWLALEPKFDEYEGQELLQIHGGGFAQALFELLQKNNIFCIILFKFCSEGDNIPDAIELINYFNSWLQLFPIIEDKKVCNFKFPPSFKFLFGNSAPREIY